MMKRERGLSAITDPSLWRKTGDYESDASNWREIRERILIRDAYTCQECGFVCDRYQEVHHINGDHTDNRPENLETLCTYCHGTQHIGFTGVNERGVLIYLPEMTAAELIGICRWLVLSEYFQNAYINVIPPQRGSHYGSQQAVQQKHVLTDFFNARIAKAASIFKTTRLTDIATAMRVLNDEQSKNMREVLSKCLIYPNLHNYPDGVLSAWSNTLNGIVNSKDTETTYLKSLLLATGLHADLQIEVNK